MGKGGDPGAAIQGRVAPQLLAWLACWLAGSKGGPPARAQAEGDRSSDAAQGAYRAGGIWDPISGPGPRGVGSHVEHGHPSNPPALPGFADPARV